MAKALPAAPRHLLGSRVCGSPVLRAARAGWAGPGAAPRGRGRVGEPGSARSREQQHGMCQEWSHGSWRASGWEKVPGGCGVAALPTTASQRSRSWGRGEGRAWKPPQGWCRSTGVRLSPQSAEELAPSGQHQQGSRVGKQVDIIAAIHLEKRKSVSPCTAPIALLGPPTPSPLPILRCSEAGAPVSRVAGLTSKRPMRAAAWRARITSVSTHIC